MTKTTRASTIETTIATITPSRAREWLAMNIGNRHPARTSVDCYAEDMAKGRWELNGDAIKFNGDGTLLDGQQRLMACVQARKSFKSVVVRNLRSKAQETMDTGRRRSLSDVLAMRGVPHATFVSGMVTTLIRIKTKEAHGTRISTRHGLEITDRHKDGLVEVARLAGASPHIMGPRPCSVAAIYYIGDYLMGDEAYALAFMQAFKTGESTYVHDAAIALRERLIRLRQQGAHIHIRTQLWAIVAAYNAFREERPVEKVIWPKEPIDIDGFDVSLI